MAFNLAEFTSSLSAHGVIQTNKFEVLIHDTRANRFPFSLINSNIITADNQRMVFELLKDRIESVKLPGLVIDTFGSKRYGIGPTLSVGTNVSFEPLSITILSDRNMILHKFFIAWFNYIFDGMSNRGSSTPTFLNNYKENYSADITVKIFNNSGVATSGSTIISGPSSTHRIIEAFPVSITEPMLSWGSNNNLYKFDVSFLYTNWATDNITDMLSP